MIKKRRMWIGATMLLVIAFNYALIGFPLYKRSSSVDDAMKGILIKQAKAGKAAIASRDSYILDVLRREKRALDRNVLILNCFAATGIIVIASWTIFGMIFHKKEEGFFTQKYGNP